MKPAARSPVADITIERRWPPLAAIYNVRTMTTVEPHTTKSDAQGPRASLRLAAAYALASR